MERRLLLAILLTFLVLTGYQWLCRPPAPQPAAKASSHRPAAPSSATSPGSRDAAWRPAPAALPAVETVVADTAERTITVDNGVVRAVFSNRGGTLVSWQLTQYRDSTGKPLDLVPHDLPASDAASRFR